MSERTLGTVLHLQERFLRSTDLKRDFGDASALEGYWLTEFGAQCLRTVATGVKTDSGRRAWRLTGDYGTGKSAFALFLATAMSDVARLPAPLKRKALQAAPDVAEARYAPVLVMGSRQGIGGAILSALHATIAKAYPRGGAAPLLDALKEAMESPAPDDDRVVNLVEVAARHLAKTGKARGLLIVLDEVGKFLEYAANSGGSSDIFLLQRLSEAASRSKDAPVFLVCLLHQGFNAYADQLQPTAQREWAKIAGRFDEIAFAQPIEERLALAEAALGVHVGRIPANTKEDACEVMRQAAKLRWFGGTASADGLVPHAEGIFPIDAFTFPALGRFFQRFGQNERSLFSFIYSYEPFGLRDYAARPVQGCQPYRLHNLFDYARANFGHRLAVVSYRSRWTMIEAIIEGFATTSELQSEVLKTVGILNLLDGDDLAPSAQVIEWAVGGADRAQRQIVHACLADLCRRSVLYLRGVGKGYCLWPYTSVDLEKALDEAKLAVGNTCSVTAYVEGQIDTRPIVARRHYITTGNLRHFTVTYCPVNRLAEALASDVGDPDGEIIVALCETQSERLQALKTAGMAPAMPQRIRLIGVPRPLERLQGIVSEALRWDWIAANVGALNNDAYARAEVDRHRAFAQEKVHAALQETVDANGSGATEGMEWFHDGQKLNPEPGCSFVKRLSALCDNTYKDAPRLHNELLNRRWLSSAAASARMRLIEAMFEGHVQAFLGLPQERTPPEVSMYLSVLLNTGIHRQNGDSWQLGIPEGDDPCTMRPCMARLKAIVESKPDERVSVKSIMDEMKRAPYGLRDGVIGSQQLQADCGVWVRIAAAGLPLTDTHLEWWSTALRGLVDSKALSLERMADYVSATRKAIVDEGHPIIQALGFALPSLHVPRDSGFFAGLTDKTAKYPSKWRALFLSAYRKRACYLVKQTPVQGLLTEDDLTAAFSKVRDSMPASLHGTVEAFIHAAPGWGAEALALAENEWELIKPLFDGMKKEAFNLGKATAEFYDESHPDVLAPEEVAYLQRLAARKALDADEDDADFYRRHRQEMKEKPGLKARWDKFIYGAPVEAEDFLAGLAECLESLFDQDQQGTRRKLRITTERRTKRDLKELNCDAGLYFAFRYKGLPRLLGRACSWEVGDLMEFPALDAQWRAAGRPFVNRSVAKGALQLKFYLELEVTLPQGTVDTFSKQLIWKFDPSAVSSELRADWLRLVKNPFLRCSATREVVNSKGKIQTVDLRDSRSLLPTFDKDRGSLVPAYQRSDDLEVLWTANLKTSLAAGFVTPETHALLSRLFDAFSLQYRAALQGFVEDGLPCGALLQQAQAYGELLTCLCRDAKGDRNRDALLKPLLELGAAPVSGGSVTTVVAPWHPLRLAAVAVKAGYVARLVKHLLSAENVLFGDAGLYFEELVSEMRHPFYPEFILGWNDKRPELLSLGDHHLDYTLHESPLSDPENYSDTNENPSGSADRVIELVSRYLSLHPHEQANLSVVLYNCDSARLPQAIVDRMNELHEDEEDLRCQVMLRHRNAGKLRRIYEKIVESTDANADSFVASEATRDFMARLRIGIMVDQAPPPDAADGPPKDIVFLQDVIARHARLEWCLEDARPEPIETWIPPRWARRRPAAMDDMKSIVYLCCPVASKEVWAFRTAVTTFLKGDWDGKESRRLLPARQLDFNDPTTASIFKEVHNLGNWVVNYDELLDRRQLQNQSVKVIRFKQSDTQGRNILISSTAPLGLLKTMVLQRVRDLDLGLTPVEYHALTQRLIADANEVSGDLVLRAAKRGRNASELIGVVLSRFLIKKELGEAGRFFGWYFLDDYANWLGQREEQIADIMCLSPEKAEDGTLRLAVVLSEAKYIDYASLRPKATESQRQLRQTMDRIGKALFGDPGRLDRDIWLSRFSDMVLSGIQFPATKDLGLSEWRRAIRDGKCSIYLRGYSHVFVSGPADAPEVSDRVDVSDCADAFQEVFSPAKLRELLLHYWHQSDPAAVRMETVAAVYKSPSERRGPDGAPWPAGAATVVPTIPAPPPGPAPAAPPADSPPCVETPVPPVPPLLPPDGTCWAWAGIAESLSVNGSGDGDSEEDQAWLVQTANAAKSALQQFLMNSKLLASTLTPNAALLKFQGSANLTVEQVLKRRSEFLTTHRLNLVSVRPEPGVVSIAVARTRRRMLQLDECWQRWKPACSAGNTDLLVGLREEDGGLLLISPVRNAPHTLIAGATGSGKSVLMQNLVLSMAATNTPEQLKLTLIDPKMGVDYFAFETLPHLSEPIITTPDRAMVVLTELVAEMNRRYEVLRANRVPNVMELRQKIGATEQPPILWVVHDEFAEWMMTAEYRDGVSDIVSRLGVKARAAGIFLIFAAQRPDANVMPMQLRANLGNRLVLRVDGEGTSEIALSEKGAERLLGKGHLAARLEGEDGTITGQVPYVSPDRIAAMVHAIEKQWAGHGQ